MTKKDYELIASTIKGRIKNAKNLDKFDNYSATDIELSVAILTDLSEYLAVELKKENSRFNSNKFLHACGDKD